MIKTGDGCSDGSREERAGGRVSDRAGCLMAEHNGGYSEAVIAVQARIQMKVQPNICLHLRVHVFHCGSTAHGCGVAELSNSSQ